MGFKIDDVLEITLGFLYCPASQSQTQPRDGEATSLVWDIGWREQEAQWPFLVNLKTEKPSEEEIKSK